MNPVIAEVKIMYAANTYSGSYSCSFRKDFALSEKGSYNISKTGKT